MIITVVSFGFRNGLPLDADLIFDVRFLPNPYYVDSLKSWTAITKKWPIMSLKWPVTEKYLTKLYHFMEFCIPQYVNEGRLQLVIGIGCTGKHRSVTIANQLRSF